LSPRVCFFGRTALAPLAFVLTLCLGPSSASSPAFAEASSISGAVTDVSDGAVLQNLEVCAWLDSFSEPVPPKEQCVRTAADGGYEISSLGNGTYRVKFWPRGTGLNYIAEYYDDEQWRSDATPILLGPDDHVAGIDAQLRKGGIIQGRVISSVGGAPIASLLVCARGPYVETCDLTDTDGQYEIFGLHSGAHRIEFIPTFNGLKYTGEYYDNQITEWRSNYVAVSLGQVKDGIDAVLEPTSEIRGAITTAATGAPLRKILVCVSRQQDYDKYFLGRSNTGGCARTNDSGEYAVGGLLPGQYGVMFSVELREYYGQLPPHPPEPDGYPTTYWNEESTWGDADFIPLVAPTIAAGINARLGPPGPAPIATPLASPALPLSTRVKHRCKQGLVRKKVKGKRRCVKRRHPRKHSRHQGDRRRLPTAQPTH
jgi:hypothetical protein